MIEGHVSQDLDLIVEIGLIRKNQVTRIPALVDTGFSGHLCLAQRHVDLLDLTFHHVERYELANGEVIAADVFRGTIVFGEERREVDVIITASDDTLIGASLLREYVLTVHYPARWLRIESPQ